MKVVPQQGAYSNVVDDSARKSTSWTQFLVFPSRNRQVSRFWLEKALVLTDAMQLFALMWQLRQPWPWPARWLAATRWTNIFNLDLVSFRSTTSQSFSVGRDLPNYWLYATIWALVPWSSITILRIAKKLWTKRGRSDFLLLSVKWENVLLQMFQLLYVPIGLAVLRLLDCYADDGIMSVDRKTSMICGSAGYVTVVLLVTCGLGGSFLVGLPWVLRGRIRQSIVHSSVEEHERFVQAKELEFILGTSETYLELYMPQFSSFNRHSVEMPVQMCMLKLVLMLVLSALNASQGMQGSIFFLAVMSMAVYRTRRFPFRCISTSHLVILLDWMLVANAGFVLLCSNGVRNALTKSTSVAPFLIFMNSCFLAVLCFLGLRDIALNKLYPSLAEAKKLHWPTHQNMKDIVQYQSNVASWVKSIRNVQSTILVSLLITPSMRSCEDLQDALNEIYRCYEEAASADHLLMGQLYELALYVNEIYVEAVASSPFHQPASNF